MNEGLKKELQALGLLPLFLDKAAKAELKKQGIPLSKAEAHLNPGMQRDIHEITDRVDRNVHILYEMEMSGEACSASYIKLEKEILSELEILKARDRIGRHGHPATGTGAICRDTGYS